MNIVTRLAVGSLAVLAVAAPTAAFNASAAPAVQQQTSRSWTTIETMQHAKHQACKVRINGGTAWKIYNRLDSRNATGPRLRASMVTTEGGPGIAYSWTSGWVHRGELSAVGSVIKPDGPAYQLEMSLSGDNAGKGGPISPRDIGRC